MMTTETVPFVHWNELEFQWSQGEHVALIGATGLGKTTLALNLLPMRRYIVVFASKPRDKVMTSLRKQGYKYVKEWKPYSPAKYPKRLLWPPADKLDSKDKQRETFHDAFERIYVEGSWTVFVDETWYLVNTLHLGQDIKTYLLQARSLNISLLLAAQRPAWIPVEVFNQSTHLFFFRENDERNLKRISDIGWLSAQTIRREVANLPKHITLYVNSRDGTMFKTQSPRMGAA